MGKRIALARDASGRWRLLEQLTHMTASSTGADDLTAAVEEVRPSAESGELPKYWEGPITFENMRTGDSRFLLGDSLVLDVTPDNTAPLRFVMEDIGAHDAATIVGRMLTLERRNIEETGLDVDRFDPDTKVIWATGDFDLDSENGREAARRVLAGVQQGVSVDLDDVEFVIDGEFGSDVADTVTKSARIRAVTLVAIPAFRDAQIFARQEQPESLVLALSGIEILEDGEGSA